jgi:transglutaminase-like putative cysteine protease
MMYRVRHTTTYAYTNAVSVSHNVLHVTPRECRHQRCSLHELLIYPQPAFINQAEDYFGNPVTYFSLQEPHEALTMTANSIVDVTPLSWPEPQDTPPWDQVGMQLRQECSREGLDAYQFVFDSPYVPTGPDVAALAAPFFPPGRPLLEAVCDFMHYIYTEFTYDPEATTVSTPIDEVMAQRHGVCQDFAHLQIAGLRSYGLAARYVSGYLVAQPPKGQDPLVGALASHAWLSVYCPEVGWIDVDPTNDVLPAEVHITVAYGRDYGDVSPIKGVFLGGGEHALDVSVDVVPIHVG